MNRSRALLLALFPLAAAGAVALFLAPGRPETAPTPSPAPAATAPAPSGNGGRADAAASPAPGPAYAPADLFSGDPDRALAAAAALDPSTLTLAELRRQQGLLAEHPAVYYRAPSSWGIGNRELPVLFRETAKAGKVWTADTATDPGETHRSFLAGSMAALVEAMAAADSETFGELLSYLKWMAATNSGGKRAAARGFLYALARRREAARGRPPPPLESIRLGDGDGAYPAGFVALARTAWLDPAPDEAAVPTDLFLLRLGRELTPGPADESLLVDLARHGRSPEARVFATAALGRLPGEAAEAVLREIAAGEDVAAAIAAYSLATRGEPTRLRELAALPRGSASPDRPVVAAVLRLHALPEEGLVAWKKAIETPPSEGSSPGPPGEIWLDPEGRADLEGRFGIRLTAAELDAMAVALAGADVPLGTLLSFYGRIWPEGLRGPAIDRLLDALASARSEEGGELEWMDEDALAHLLARVEVRAPDRLRDLLRGWARTTDAGLRETALRLLARLGDTGFVPETIDRYRADVGAFGFPPTLGRMHDPRVREFLEAEATCGDAERESAAVAELLVWHGLAPAVARPLFAWVSGEETEEEVRRLALAGDAAGTALARGQPLALLGLIDDERVVPWLRERRKDREVYWEATGALALAGDPDARAELRGAIEDGRTWILEILDEQGVLTLGGDPELVELWISRIDANCCHGLVALAELASVFPLLDIGYIPRDMAEVRARIERWWARHRGNFAWSRLVDGWVER